MIRRWSCIINLTNNFENFSNFNKSHKISLFKSSVNFKKFTFKFTKFKRKALIRLKHKSLFLIYTNILKFWVKDFMFNKLYLKYQFFNKILLKNFFFYNFNFIKSKSELFFYNFNFIFNTLSNKKFSYFFNTKFIVKNSPLTTAWFLNQPEINNSIIPYFMNWQNSYFPYQDTSNPIFDINSIFDIFFDSFFKTNIEVRRILTLLFFYKLNFKS
jgi:hypothetical protein